MEIHVTMNVAHFARQMANNEKFLEKKAIQIVDRFAKWGRDMAKRYAPIDTGRLRRSIMVYKRNGGLTADVKAMSKYAIYVDQGTGIYALGGGGRRSPWMYKHRTLGWIRTRGQRPKQFMDKAYRSMLRNADDVLQGVFKWR